MSSPRSHLVFFRAVTAGEYFRLQIGHDIYTGLDNHAGKKLILLWQNAK
jgi:hypothetical protein